MFIGFGDIGRHFSKNCTETFKKKVHNPKRRRPRFQKMKNCFFNSWYCISETHDSKPNIKRSFRQIALPKHDSAFEQKTRIVSSREIWGSSQNTFSTYNQKNAKQSSNGHFWKTLNVVLESFCFAQETKAVFISIRYHKTSQPQDVKTQSTNRNLRKLVQAKPNSAAGTKLGINSRTLISWTSHNTLFSRN